MDGNVRRARTRARASLVAGIVLVLVTAGTAFAASNPASGTTVRGRVSVREKLHTDGTTTTDVALVDEHGKRVEVTGHAAAALAARSGQEVSVAGAVANNTVAAGSFHWIGGRRPPYAGPVRAIVIRFSQGVGPSHPTSAAKWQSLMFGPSNSLKTMLETESEHAITLSGDVVDDALPAGTTTDCRYDGQWAGTLAAKHPGYDLYLLANDKDCGLIAGEGDGLGFTWYYGSLRQSTIWHEIGHNLGFNHANRLAGCYADRPVSISPTCQSLEYQDPYSPMGAFLSGVDAACAYPAYDDIVAKWNLPWQEVTTTSHVELSARNNHTNGKPRAIVIPGAPAQWGGFYMLEWHSTDYTSCPNKSDTGLQIRVVDNAYTWGKTNIVDARFDFAHPYSPSLPVGRTFVDEMSGITVKLVSEANDIAQLDITVPNGPTTTTTTTATTTTTTPTTGSAKVASIANGQVHFVDGANTADLLQVSDTTGGVVIVDAGVTAGPGCVTLVADTVGCAGATSVVVDAGGGDDVVMVQESLPTVVHGGAGNDVFYAGTVTDGRTTFTGDAGTDTADYRDRTKSITVSLDKANNDGATGERDTIAADVEVVITGRGNDHIRVRNGAATTVDCGAGRDTVTVDQTGDTTSGCEQVQHG